MAERALMTEREASRWLGLCTRTLWKLRKAGQIPYVQIGRRVMYDRADLVRWIEGQKVGVCDD